MQVLWDGAVAMPGGLLVIACSTALVALFGLSLYKGDGLDPRARRLASVFLWCAAVLVVLGPALWESTIGMGEFDNQGLPYVPMVIVIYGVPVAIACALPALLVWFVMWAAQGFPPRTGERGPDSRPALLTWLALFVPSMSFVVWLGVGLGMTG